MRLDATILEAGVYSSTISSRSASSRIAPTFIASSAGMAFPRRSSSGSGRPDFCARKFMAGFATEPPLRARLQIIWLNKKPTPLEGASAKTV